MGNSNGTPSFSSKSAKISFPSKRFKKRRNGKSDSQFIERYHRENDNSIITDLSSFDQRRLVFVSLIGLLETWKKCPSVQLYSAIFILPLQRKWIYNLTKYRQEITSNLLSKPDNETMTEFIELLKWKDSQNLVCWMLDHKTSQNNEENENRDHTDLVCSFWTSFSMQLSNLYDPVTQSTYNPIQFDQDWWRNEYNKTADYSSKFQVKTSAVFMELYFNTRQYKVIQEIIFQSNPTSLNPIIAYTEQVNADKDVNSNRMIKVKFNTAVNAEVNNGGDEWFVCSEYFDDESDANDDDDDNDENTDFEEFAKSI